MTAHAGQFVLGLVLLLVGGRLLVAASVDTARRLGVSTLVVGLTLVAWGTSAPELALNVVSALKGRGDLALGNVVGANICNMALVLGVGALIRPLVVQRRLLAIEVWLNLAVLGFFAIAALTLGIGRGVPGVMLLVFGLYSMWTIMSAMRDSRGQSPAERAAMGEDPLNPGAPMGWVRIGASFAGGLVLLSFGGSLASDGASGAAVALGVPPSVVGVTIVSIGTTLPELVTSLLAIRKGQTDLAVGNALGSCLFNAGAVLGVAALIAPPDVGPAMTLPIVYMGLLALALPLVCRTFDHHISRLEGGLLVASYAVFLVVSAVLVSR